MTLKFAESGLDLISISKSYKLLKPVAPFNMAHFVDRNFKLKSMPLMLTVTFHTLVYIDT